MLYVELGVRGSHWALYMFSLAQPGVLPKKLRQTNAQLTIPVVFSSPLLHGSPAIRTPYENVHRDAV